MSVTDLRDKMMEDDVDMDLPNDEEDMHKIIQQRRNQQKKAGEHMYDDKKSN